MKPGSGALPVDVNFKIAFTGHTESRLDAPLIVLAQLHRQSGLLLPKPVRDAAQATLVVHTDHASKEIQELGDESYCSKSLRTAQKLNAANPLGVLRGLQTFSSSSKYRSVSPLLLSPFRTSRVSYGADS